MRALEIMRSCSATFFLHDFLLVLSEFLCNIFFVYFSLRIFLNDFLRIPLLQNYPTKILFTYIFLKNTKDKK